MRQAPGLAVIVKPEFLRVPRGLRDSKPWAREPAGASKNGPGNSPRKTSSSELLKRYRRYGLSSFVLERASPPMRLSPQQALSYGQRRNGQGWRANQSTLHHVASDNLHVVVPRSCSNTSKRTALPSLPFRGGEALSCEGPLSLADNPTLRAHAFFKKPK